MVNNKIIPIYRVYALLFISGNLAQVASCYLKYHWTHFPFLNRSTYFHFKAITHRWTTPLMGNHLFQWVYLCTDQNRHNAQCHSMILNHWFTSEHEWVQPLITWITENVFKVLVVLKTIIEIFPNIYHYWLQQCCTDLFLNQVTNILFKNLKD